MTVATGLQFVDDGATNEAPSNQRHAYQPDRYGDRWAPVLLAWLTPKEQPDFAGFTVGEAGSQYVQAGSSPGRFLVTGTVELDAVWFRNQIARNPTGTQTRAVLLHEFGHLLGLAHAADPSQIMFAQERPEVSEFGSGDLAGLAVLGRGSCAPQL